MSNEVGKAFVNAQVEALKKQLLELRFAVKQGNDKVDTSQFKKLKADIARLKSGYKL